MKRLMSMSFIILLSVLMILSGINFSYIALEEIEKDKQTIIIEKNNNITNKKFLIDIENILGTLDEDIMYRYVDISGEKPKYLYFKTNYTEDFIRTASSSPDFLISEEECISTFQQDEYKSFHLRASSLLRDISFYNWNIADRYDLSSGTYYVKKDVCNQIAEAISELGYKVTVNTNVFISGKMSVLLFSSIPTLLLIMSILFYVLSSGKRSVIKKMDGYTVKDILIDEIRICGKGFVLSFLVVEVISMIITIFLFGNVWLPYIEYASQYVLVALGACIIGGLIGILIIYTQNKVEYIKGRVPKKGIYYLSMIAKCIFVSFITFFMTIAIRNVQVYYSTFITSHFLSEKVSEYVTVPINTSNAPLSGLEDNYFVFYKETVDKYNGIIIDADNYEYDIVSGISLYEEYGQDDITVNDNYLKLNPIYDLENKQIDVNEFDEQKMNVLLPISKQGEADRYRKKIKQGYELETNFILYDDTVSKIYAYNAEMGTGAYGEIESPVILVPRDSQFTGMYILSYCSSGQYFLKPKTNEPYSELLPLLKKVGIEKVTFQTPYIISNFDRVLEQQFQMLILYGSQTLILSIGLLCLIIFTGKLYCENYRDKLACSICEGYTLQKSMQRHFMLTLIIYGIAILGIYGIGKMIIVSINLYLPIIALIIDIVCTTIICNRYIIKNLNKIMKGAD